MGTYSIPVFRDGVEVNFDRRSLNEPVESLVRDDDGVAGIFSLEFFISAVMSLAACRRGKRNDGEEKGRMWLGFKTDIDLNNAMNTAQVTSKHVPARIQFR